MELAGHECVGFCEFDKYAVMSYTAMHLCTQEQLDYLATLPLKQRQKEILKDEYKNGEWYADDVRRVDARDIPEADCWCFGFPCTDISVAGLQKGLSGERSSLFFEIIRLLEERKANGLSCPGYLFIENVKNLLSVNRGIDFAKVLFALDERGFDAEWQVLNSKDFGVPQNRERVFVVGHKRGTERSNIFPIARYDNVSTIDKVFLLSERIAVDGGFFQEIHTERQGISVEKMQELLKQIQQGLQEGTSREISKIGPEVRQFAEGSLSEIEAEYKRTQSSDRRERFCGLVSIPTEKMLLLWYQGRGFTQVQRRIQQQGESSNDRQNKFIERLRKREHGSLLLAVQSYKGRLFYSIGDGENWTYVYSKEVGICRTTLSSILEVEAPQKYFLSKEQTERIVFAESDRSDSFTEQNQNETLRGGECTATKD